MSDKLAASLEAFIRSVFGHRLDYLASYPAKVVSQNADGSLELVPDDGRLPTYSKVPIRYVVPGLTATVSAGARALLSFAGADPRKPIVTGFEAGSGSLVTLNLVGTTLNLGATSGLQGAGLGDQLATALSNIVTFLTTHTHPGVTTGPGTTGVSLTLPPTIGTVSSSSVKVKP
jgi:hypothetical protein